MREKERSQINLEGGTIISHVLKSQEMESQTGKFFLVSPFWRAIRDHVYDAETRWIFVDPPNSLEEEEPSIKCYRSRYGITFKEAVIYGRDPNQEFVLTIEVEWIIDNEVFAKRHHIRNIPFDILTDFSDEKFDAWIKKFGGEKKFKRSEQEKAQLKYLIKRYPVASAAFVLGNRSLTDPE